MESSLVVNASRTTATRRKGKYRMVEFKSLKQAHGVPVAKQLRDAKKQQEKTKATTDPIVYWMQHPDFPDKEDMCIHAYMCASV